MKKLELELTMTCHDCGHAGKVYLKGAEVDKFNRDCTMLWYKNVGWKLILFSFCIGSCAGFLFGWWKP